MARILLVNTRYRPPYFRGGVERYVHVLGRAFTRRGHDCRIVAFDEPVDCETDVPHDFLAVPKIPFLRPLLFSWLGRRLWRSADILVLQYTPLGLLMPASKLICTVHTTGYGEAQALAQMSGPGLTHWWKRARRRFSLPFERHVLRRAQMIVAISPQIAEELTTAYGIPPERIAVVGNGVDCSEFRPDESPKGRTPFRVLYVGRLAPRKNVDLLVKAIAQCKANVVLRIVGTGPELAAIQDLTKNLGLSERVTFQGFRKGPDLLAEYQWADVLVMPSSYEGLPLVALEAKAAGAPVIAADFPGAARIVPDTSGRIVESITSSSLAAAIDQMASDPRALNALASNARREAMANFSWDAVVDQLSRHYERVLQGRPATPV